MIIFLLCGRAVFLFPRVHQEMFCCCCCHRGSFAGRTARWCCGAIQARSCPSASSRIQQRGTLSGRVGEIPEENIRRPGRTALLHRNHQNAGGQTVLTGNNSFLTQVFIPLHGVCKVFSCTSGNVKKFKKNYLKIFNFRFSLENTAGECSRN